jgi:hypothetical protein
VTTARHEGNVTFSAPTQSTLPHLAARLRDLNALCRLGIDAPLGKFLEPANVKHCREAQILKGLPGKGRATS